MTLLEPRIAITRLVITKDGERVYDQDFHLGVNIIRGENGSGKSTIADFIFFALGGELTRWHEEMKLCDYSYAEVLLNREVATLRRDISGGSTRRSMSLFWGPYESARTRPLEEWLVFPFAASPTKQSFSQALFRALGIPEVRGELSSRLTMHQLLRLMYADQLTEVTALFRSEQFDSALIRDAVGSLLCGIYDSRLYEAQFELARRQAQYNQLEGRLDNIFVVLADSNQSLDSPALSAAIGDLEKERTAIYERLNSQDQVEVKESDTEQRIGSALRARLSAVKKTLQVMEDELESIQFEIADSERFLKAMRLQDSALADSATIREFVGNIEFRHCPACYSPIEREAKEHVCALCMSENAEPRGETPIARMRQEITLQIQESEQLQASRLERREQLLQQLPSLEAQRRELQLKLNELSNNAVSERERVIRELSARLGYIDREIHDLQQRLTFANAITALRDAKAQLASEISKLEDEIRELTDRRESRRSEAYVEIADRVIILLREDLPREERFIAAERVDFDFGADRISVNGVQVFAASSMTYLKNSFHLALHLASLQDAAFRYPRFTLFDNIEDKGMEQERSHNFQRLVIRETESFHDNHQVIMTTSMIAPELDDPRWVVGPYYTKANKTLRLGGISDHQN